MSTYGDVHSFGILFTGKRLTKNVFADGQNLQSVVKAVRESRSVDGIIASSLFDDMEEIEYTAGRSSRAGGSHRVMI